MEKFKGSPAASPMYNRKQLKAYSFIFSRTVAIEGAAVSMSASTKSLITQSIVLFSSNQFRSRFRFSFLPLVLTGRIYFVVLSLVQAPIREFVYTSSHTQFRCGKAHFISVEERLVDLSVFRFCLPCMEIMFSTFFQGLGIQHPTCSAL